MLVVHIVLYCSSIVQIYCHWSVVVWINTIQWCLFCCFFFVSTRAANQRCWKWVLYMLLVVDTFSVDNVMILYCHITWRVFCIYDVPMMKHCGYHGYYCLLFIIVKYCFFLSVQQNRKTQFHAFPTDNSCFHGNCCWNAWKYLHMAWNLGQIIKSTWMSNILQIYIN